MQIFKLTEKNRRILKEEIESGAVFVYPTDTIYGIGCNALDESAVKQIRKIKGRYEKPFSVIAPSKEWILNNCFFDKSQKKYLDKLPGKYTLIFKLRSKDVVSKEVSKETLGVRIPKHWISDMVRELGFPVVTTSVNKTGDGPITELKQIDKKLLKNIDFAIDEGKLGNRPSRVVDLTAKKAKILR